MADFAGWQLTGLTVLPMPHGFRRSAVFTILISCFGFVPASATQSEDGARERAILEIQQSIENGNLAQARELLQASAKEFGDDAGLDNLSGVIQAQEHHYSAAEASFKQALKRQPRFTAAYLNLGRLYQENSFIDSQARKKALQIYDRVLTYDPSNTEANYQSALLLLENRKYQRSLIHVSRLPKNTRESAQVASVSCADYAGLGDQKRSQTELAKFLASPDFSESDVRQVLLGTEPDKRDDVTVPVLEALQRREQLPADLEQSLGLAYERSGRLSDARSILEKFAVEQMSVPSLFDVARVAHKQRDYEGTLGYLAHARDLEPDNASVHYSFGVVCLDLELLAEARNAFEKAVKLDPGNASYNYAMGTTSLFSHDPERAIPYFKQYLKLKPQDPRGKLAVGIAFFRAKDYDDAAPWFDQAAQRPQTATTAHYFLGSVALQKHRLDEALRQLQSALRSKPDYPDALAELGHYYFMRSEYSAAEKELQRALKLDPDHFAANFYLLSLYARTQDPRREEQAKRYDQLQKVGEAKSQELLRTVEVRPFEGP